MENLKRLRKEKGLTQVGLAMQANVSPRSIQNYELDTRTPIAKAAIKVARALGTTVEGLFEGEDLD